MFVIKFKGGQFLQCSDGNIYQFATAKEAAIAVDMCYGYSFFKNGTLKLLRLPGK